MLGFDPQKPFGLSLCAANLQEKAHSVGDLHHYPVETMMKFKGFTLKVTFDKKLYFQLRRGDYTMNLKLFVESFVKCLAILVYTPFFQTAVGI